MTRTESSVRASTFFALTYALSWLIWIPLVLSHFHIGPFSISEGVSSGVRLLGVLMPATAALILTALSGGRSGLRALLARLTIWRVGWRWWAAAALVQPLLLVGCALAYNAFGGRQVLAPAGPMTAAAVAVNLIFLALATLGEEIGWRGVALPALQWRQNAVRASVVLGVLWAVWHIPFWLLLKTFDQFGPGYLALNFLLMPMTFFITWFFNHTRSSLLLPIAFHLTFNIVNVVWLPVTLNIGAFALLVAAEWLLGLAVIPHLGEPHVSSLKSQ
jgi:membrane protease YdiL (CAAX protease family)